MRVTHRGLWALGTVAALAGGCSGEAESSGTARVEAGRSASLSSGGEDAVAAGEQHCDLVNDGRHEETSYDTSGDDVPDVRKVFLRVGDDTMSRLVLVCRETDVNGDGVKDVVRQYTTEGSPQREEADRNFDGKMDEITHFQNGRVVRQEVDSNRDGKIDLKVFYKDGAPQRAERDMAGRSTAAKWQPDRWEYYEGEHLVRMGTDLDGDGKVDRWDRDQTAESRAGGLRSDESVIDQDTADDIEEAEAELEAESDGG